MTADHAVAEKLQAGIRVAADRELSESDLREFGAGACETDGVFAVVERRIRHRFREDRIGPEVL